MLIGFYSSAPQSGKTIASEVLVDNFQFRKVSFAAPVKSMIIDLLLSMDYSYQEASDLVYYKKEEIIPELQKTSRELQQKLGTEWGRDMIYRDMWTDITMQKANKLRHCVIDDVRFAEEAIAIKDSGGFIFRIVRNSTSYEGSHSSEGRLDNFGFDEIISNDSTLCDFAKKVIDVVRSRGLV